MSLFKHMAILGRQPELGLVELESLLGADNVEPIGPAAALFRGEVEIGRLGGVVKLARLLYDGPEVSLTKLMESPHELWRELPVGGGKTPFAVSVYGGGMSSGAVTAAGLELKKYLKVLGPVRLVAPTTGAEVTAAQLKFNRVLELGFELVVVRVSGRLVVGLTLAVQDIDWYSERDYGRPARSARVGMLPPKLAQVLVNTTESGAVADPFCGSGVVLSEALLLGRKVSGTDTAPEMVDAANRNLTWLERKVSDRQSGAAGLPEWQVSVADARQVGLAPGVAVVTEGYLGTPFVHSPAPAELELLKHELLDLYRLALANWARQLPSGAEVSLCVPAWRVGKRWHYLGLVDLLPKLGYTQKVFRHVSTPLLYSRADQVVGRQLLFLRKG